MYQGFLPCELGLQSVDDFSLFMRKNGFITNSESYSNIIDVINNDGDILDDFKIASDGFWFLMKKLKLKVTSKDAMKGG